MSFGLPVFAEGGHQFEQLALSERDRFRRALAEGRDQKQIDDAAVRS
jgi:hypothetical protein